MRIYSIADRIPHYVNKLNIKSDDEVLLTNLFDRSSYLCEGLANQLMQDFRGPSIQCDQTIEEGASKLN